MQLLLVLLHFPPLMPPTCPPSVRAMRLAGCLRSSFWTGRGDQACVTYFHVTICF